MFFIKLRRKSHKLRWLKADDILPNPHQPRRQIDEAELAKLSESVRRNGILHPLLVCQREDGCFELLSGERRLLAARRASLAKVPCVILPPQPISSAMVPLCDALHSCGLDVFEEAAAIRRMMDSFRLSRSAAAARLGITESALAAKLSALKLNDLQRSRALSLKLSEAEIREIVSLSPQNRDIALGIMAPERPPAENEPRRRISGAADLRFFENSLNRLVESLTSAGLKAQLSRKNSGSFAEFTIRVGRSDAAERQLTLF